MKIFQITFYFLCIILISCSQNQNNREASKITDATQRFNLKESIQNLVIQKISTYLSYPVKAEFDTINSYNNWFFVCGVPKQTNDHPVDYLKTKIADQFSEGLVDDYFCVLIEKNENELNVRELVVGDTDSPMLDWLEKYRLPESLLSPD